MVFALKKQFVDLMNSGIDILYVPYFIMKICKLPFVVFANLLLTIHAEIAFVELFYLVFVMFSTV